MEVAQNPLVLALRYWGKAQNSRTNKFIRRITASVFDLGELNDNGSPGEWLNRPKSAKRVKPEEAKPGDIVIYAGGDGSISTGIYIMQEMGKTMLLRLNDTNTKPEITHIVSAIVSHMMRLKPIEHKA